MSESLSSQDKAIKLILEWALATGDKEKQNEIDIKLKELING